MGENKGRAKGKLQEAAGAVKETVGKVTGNQQMETEGRAAKYAGKARSEVAKGIGRAKGDVEELTGQLKQGLGQLSGDDRLHAEGEADALKGKARKRFNQ